MRRAAAATPRGRARPGSWVPRCRTWRKSQRRDSRVHPGCRAAAPRRSTDGGPVDRAYGRCMSSETPLHVVIAGGGVAAVELTMALRDLGEDRVRITIVAPERDFELNALRTAEPFSRDPVRRSPLAEIAERFDAELLHAGLAGVDA